MHRFMVNFSLFVISPSVHGWTLAFFLDIHRLCVAIEEMSSHFLPSWIRMCWQSVISQEKSLEIVLRGWELNPAHREKRQ